VYDDWAMIDSSVLRVCCQRLHCGTGKVWVILSHFIDSATLLEKRSCWVDQDMAVNLLTFLGFLVFDTETTLIPYCLHRYFVQLVKVGMCKTICIASPNVQHHHACQ